MNCVQCPSDSREEVWCYSLGIKLQSTLSEKSNAQTYLSLFGVRTALSDSFSIDIQYMCVFCVSVFDETEAAELCLNTDIQVFLETVLSLNIFFFSVHRPLHPRPEWWPFVHVSNSSHLLKVQPWYNTTIR